MTIDIVVPQVGEAVAEVILVQWFKEEGDTVQQGEPLFEVDTDKVTVEIEAFADGILSKILVPAGGAVMPQQVVGTLASNVDEAQPPPSLEERTLDDAVSEEAMTAEKNRISPVARRLATELEIAPEQITGSGIGGRIVAEDVRRFVARQPAPASLLDGTPPRVLASPKARGLAAELGLDLTQLSGTGVDGLIRAADVAAAATFAEAESGALSDGAVMPLSKLRRAIAAGTQASKQTVPHFYLMADVDMTQVQALRLYCREHLAWEQAPTYTDIVVRACGLALAQMPELNAYFSEHGIGRWENIDVGVAVSVEGGLVVPVVRSVDRLQLQTVSTAVRDLAQRSRAGRLREADLGPKGIVVSNLGMHAVDAFIAIIDMPAPMILAVGRTAERVVASNGQPVVRPMCTITLSADHRVLDGVPAAEFLSAVVAHLEQPYAILGGTA